MPAWTTYHHDGTRSGYDPDSVSPVTPTQAWQTNPALDGLIYAEPLVYGSRVYVATQNDSVYALDAATGAVLWQRSAGTPVKADNAPKPGNPPCGNIVPRIGILSTPVIDPANNTIYVVGKTWDGQNPATIQHRLFGYDLTSGKPAPGLPRTVDPPGSDPKVQQQRGSLALVGNQIVIPFGGQAGDCPTYWGWLVGTRENGAGPLVTYQASAPTPTDPRSYGAGIWGGGNAPAVDAAGNIFVATGNGSYTSAEYNYSGSVLRLDASLKLVDFWAPANWLELDYRDADIGSSEPLPLANGLLFQIGKEGAGYLLRAGSLGGVGAAPAARLQICPTSVTDNSVAEAFGGGVYYPATGKIYVACHAGLQAVDVSVDPQAPSMTLTPGWKPTDIGVGPPIIAGGSVWVALWESGHLLSLDPQNGAVKFDAPLVDFQHFTTPGAGGGRLFVQNDGPSAPNRSTVTAFKIDAHTWSSSTVTTLTSSPNPSLTGAAVSLTASIRPVPNGGTVSLTDAGKPIAGCQAIPVSPLDGNARCQTSWAKRGSRALVAVYSGDASSGPSASVRWIQTVSPRPAISRLRLSPSSFPAKIGTTLVLTLSERARVKFVVAQRVAGRLVTGRCKADAKHGSRCMLSVVKSTLFFSGRAGRNRFNVHTSRLAPGRYYATITATAGRRPSTPSTIAFVVTKPPKRG
jgi:outer membrane protein assembly factor BamB